MDKSLDHIREDQHLAVLFESVLLLEEAHKALSSEKPGVYFYRVDKFIRSLKQTDMFEHPHHIRMAEMDPNDAVLITMEMQDMNC